MLNQISIGLQNDVMLVTLLYKRKGNMNFTGTLASLFSLCCPFFYFSLHVSWTIALSLFQTVPGETLLIEPALRIPRWDRRRDNGDASIQRWSLTGETRRTGANGSNFQSVIISVRLQTNSCRLVIAAIWRTERPHLTQLPTSQQTHGRRWQCAYSKQTWTSVAVLLC